ncbi:TPA: metallophosphoesterase [Candidatus Woesearchaeota archaeon]|nr:metallophosphoesterase [Candidatus Woesearchaeota archaeon]
MRQLFQFMIFFAVFITIYLSLNSYVILRLAGMLKVNHRAYLYGLIAFVVLGFPIATSIEKFFPNIISRILYTISSLWMGIVFLLFSGLILYELSRLFIRIDPFKAATTIIIIVICLTVFATINAFFINVKTIDLPIEGLKQDLKVVQLSDIHVGTIRNSGYLEKIAKKINDIDPDIVLITGDLVDGTAPLQPKMFDGLNRLRARIFFVSGNHEIYEGVDKVCALFNDSKIKVLKNEAVSFDGIQVVGVNFSESRSHLKEVLPNIKLDQKKPAILMYHPPTETETANEYGIDLQLSGHTHKGQIYPFNLLTMAVFPRYTGLHNIKGTYLYISPGTGTWGPYMRLGSRNEITVFNLKA